MAEFFKVSLEKLFVVETFSFVGAFLWKIVMRSNYLTAHEFCQESATLCVQFTCRGQVTNCACPFLVLSWVSIILPFTCFDPYRQSF
jgi:hypothetical protein